MSEGVPAINPEISLDILREQFYQKYGFSWSSEMHMAAEQAHKAPIADNSGAEANYDTARDAAREHFTAFKTLSEKVVDKAQDNGFDEKTVLLAKTYATAELYRTSGRTLLYREEVRNLIFLAEHYGRIDIIEELINSGLLDVDLANEMWDDTKDIY